MGRERMMGRGESDGKRERVMGRGESDGERE